MGGRMSVNMRTLIVTYVIFLLAFIVAASNVVQPQNLSLRTTLGPVASGYERLRVMIEPSYLYRCVFYDSSARKGKWGTRGYDRVTTVWALRVPVPFHVVGRPSSPTRNPCRVPHVF
jgi:hypothetical protein